jgi:YesN/AraC family two-component response regulator
MIQAGYEDAKAFRQLFRKIVGLSPKEYREKYAG